MRMRWERKQVTTHIFLHLHAIHLGSRVNGMQIAISGNSSY